MKINAYTIIADILGLKNTRDNIYIDTNGNKYFLDRLGFHSVNQFDNQTIQAIIKENNDLKLEMRVIDVKIKDENLKINIARKELVGKKTKKSVLAIINSNFFSDKQKFENVRSHLK